MTHLKYPGPPRATAKMGATGHPGQTQKWAKTKTGWMGGRLAEDLFGIFTKLPGATPGKHSKKKPKWSPVTDFAGILGPKAFTTAQI